MGSVAIRRAVLEIAAQQNAAPPGVVSAETLATAARLDQHGHSQLHAGTALLVIGIFSRVASGLSAAFLQDFRPNIPALTCLGGAVVGIGSGITLRRVGTHHIFAARRMRVPTPPP